jgi:hypothetical protein
MNLVNNLINKKNKKIYFIYNKINLILSEFSLVYSYNVEFLIAFFNFVKKNRFLILILADIDLDLKFNLNLIKNTNSQYYLTNSKIIFDSIF